jgi:succinate dehydrogenase / fumarate reductase membrane anchor subunit
MVKRVVVGAHYGLRDWLAQRITAVVMAVYSAIIVVVLMLGQPISYTVWRDFFAQGWMRVATLLFAASVAWHMWVGVRDILMDYVKPTGVRLSAQVLVLLVIACYLGWTVQILWR